VEPDERGTGLSVAHDLRQYLGGPDNIIELQSSVNRIRAEVRNPRLVDEAGLKMLGVYGVVLSGRVAQVVVGPQAEDLVRQLTD